MSYSILSALRRLTGFGKRRPLSSQQLQQAVTEITQNDTAALTALQSALTGEVASEDQEFVAFGLAEKFYHALWQTDRLADLDWAIGYNPALASFKKLYQKANIQWPDNIEETLEAVDSQMTRGDALGYVVAALTPSAQLAGYEIMSLNNGSDAHWMFLCPRNVADTWRGSPLGPERFFENPQWQFVTQFKALGIPVDFPKRPSV